MSEFAERAVGLAYRAGWRGVRWLPEGLARAAFDYAADRGARRNKAGTQQLRRNLARVVPRAETEELDELVRHALRSYGRYWREAFRLPSMDLVALGNEVDPGISGREYLDAALAAGNGAVVALTHSGNFDAAAVWVAQNYGEFTTVVQRLKPESLYRRFVDYRQSLGIEILPLTGGDTSTTRTLLRRLKENRVVCLVSDRDLTDTGLPVNFFGERTRMPAGPAKLSLATGAALLPVGGWFTERGWAFRIHPPIRVTCRQDVPAATQAMADVFAGDIAAHPADWHMMQPLWPADLPAADAAAVTGPTG